MNRDGSLALAGLVTAIAVAGCAASVREPVAGPVASRSAPRGVNAAVPAPAPSAQGAVAPPAAVAAAEAIRQRAGKLLAAHCTSCHDETNRLDLRTPPAVADRATWQKIASMVKSGRMPPTSKETPFPLDHDARQKLAGAAAAIGTSNRTARARPVIYASMTWVAIVHEVADPILGSAEVEQIVLRYRGGIGGLRDDVDPAPTPMPMLMPLGQVNMDRIGYDVCRRMVEVDGRAPDGAKKILPAASDRAPLDTVAAALHRRIYDEPASAEDLAAESAILKDVQSRGASLGDAAVALCTAELAGPRVMIVAGAAEGSP